MAGLEMRRLMERDEMRLRKVVPAGMPPTQPAHGTTATGTGWRRVTAQSTSTFWMPAGQVLAMSTEQFVDAYANQTEFDHKPGNHCGASYRTAMDYYAQCLRKHTLLLAHRLPQSRYHKFRRVQRAMEDWLSRYYKWNMLFETDGTFWCDAWAENAVSQQQTLADIASDFRGISQHTGNCTQDIPQVFKVLNSEIENYTLGQVYEHDDDKRFAVLGQRVKKATTSLEHEVNSLPAHSRSVILTFIKKVRRQVLECVTPFQDRNCSNK